MIKISQAKRNKDKRQHIFVLAKIQNLVKLTFGYYLFY